MIVIFSYYGSAFAVQALTKPVYGIALVLFYYDQRIRQEGFDIEWMMQRGGAGRAHSRPARCAAVAARNGSTGNRAERGSDAGR